MFLKNLILPEKKAAESASSLVFDAMTLAEELRGANIPLSMARMMLAYGAKRAGRAGMGEEFFQYREYSEGDSVAKIDWRKTAKSDEIHVRELELTNPSNYVIVLDNSASMHFAGAASAHTKLYSAAMMALALGLVIAENGDKVKLVVGEYISTIDKASVAEAAEIALNTPFIDIPRNIHPACNYIVFSDFWWGNNQFMQFADALKAAACNALMVRVVDDAEVNFTYSGRIIFQDSENADEEEVGNAEELMQVYKQHFNMHEQEIKRQAESANLIFSRFITNDSPKNFISRHYA